MTMPLDLIIITILILKSFETEEFYGIHKIKSTITE